MPQDERFAIVIIGADMVAEETRHGEAVEADSGDGALHQDLSGVRREENRGEQ